MKLLVVILVVLGAALLCVAQDKQYVCLPCGQECDRELYTAQGTCRACGMQLVEMASIKFQDLTIDEFCARLSSNPKAVLLDVRSPGEFNGTSKDVPSYGHFKNAINININELENRVGELSQYKDREVLVYCSHSHRSPRASYFLSTHGFKNVKNMTGGVSILSEHASMPCLRQRFVAH
jgi:rhodanese-related sulfurtransferase